MTRVEEIGKHLERYQSLDDNLLIHTLLRSQLEAMAKTLAADASHLLSLLSERDADNLHRDNIIAEYSRVIDDKDAEIKRLRRMSTDPVVLSIPLSGITGER